MKFVTYILLLVLMTVCLMVSFTLIRNQAHLFTSPGFAERLKVYLTQNRAHTGMQPVFPELHSGVFDVSADTLLNAVRSSLVELGWSFSSVNKKPLLPPYRIHAVVASPLFKFKDDVMIIIHDQHCQQGVLQTVLDASSSSRIGKADFGANADHIQRLMQSVRKKLEQTSPQQKQANACH